MRRTDDTTQYQTDDGGRHKVHVEFHHQHSGYGADKAAHRPHREINMTRHDHEQHAQRHHDDVAVLKNEVGQVQRLKQCAVSHHLEENHDGDQRNQQTIFAQIILEKAGASA